MEDGVGEGIYRAMIEDADGMPRLRANSTALGIRRGKDILEDHAGMVHRPSFMPRVPNGLSCAPTIHDLPTFALPRSWGGTNPHTVVWRIEESDLSSDLVAGEDGDPNRPHRHMSIGPARTMMYDDYVKLIEGTRTRWRKITKN